MNPLNLNQIFMLVNFQKAEFLEKISEFWIKAEVFFSDLNFSPKAQKKPGYNLAIFRSGFTARSFITITVKL